MKNFYEATITRPKLKLDLCLKLDPVGAVPCRVVINEKLLCDGLLDCEKTVVYQIPLTDPIDLEIQIQRLHPEAVKVSLQIDGKEILPRYQAMAAPPTCYLDNNDLWRFKIPNFYSWYHEITGQGWII